MILVVEMTWWGPIHALVNTSLVRATVGAFPDQMVRVLADPDHLDEIRADPSIRAAPQVTLQPIAIPRIHPGKPHLVSLRGFVREFTILRQAVAAVPRTERCLLVFASASSTAILAARVVRRLAGRRHGGSPIGVMVGLHGNLNHIEGWRPRNPLRRAFDLRAIMAEPRPGLRYFVLEAAIRRELARRLPRAGAVTDLLPHPTAPIGVEETAAMRLTLPLHVGLVGQATEAKGITPFLAAARQLRASHPGRFAFHLVGSLPAGTDSRPFDVLADPVSIGALPREVYRARLAGLHFVVLPLQPAYYRLSASGGLSDAMAWAKPIIATRLPMIEDMFAEQGDIGHLFDDPADLADVLAAVAQRMDADRYDSQVAAMKRLRDVRRPEALAAGWRGTLLRGFPGLLS